MIDTVITLISNSRYQDEYGVWRKQTTPREVFAQIDSVSSAEFFNGGRNGLNPAFRFTVFRGDYNGEVFCSYDEKGYAIYRTYIVPGTDYIELYVERQGGANGENNS